MEQQILDVHPRRGDGSSGIPLCLFSMSKDEGLILSNTNYVGLQYTALLQIYVCLNIKVLAMAATPGFHAGQTRCRRASVQTPLGLSHASLYT